MQVSVRIALIIGGAGGIGQASAELLAAQGTRIVIADMELEAAQRAAAALPGLGHRGYQLNVCDEAKVVALFSELEENVGPIAILGNCAGVAGYVHGRKVSLAETSLDAWESVFSINTTGVFLTVREMLRHRSAKPVLDARIINISSMAAQNGGGNSPASYVASKGAVSAMTKAIAIEGARIGVTANCVAPGAIDTPMLRAVMPSDKDQQYFSSTPGGRVGTPQEVAAAFAFLASPAASYITGACIDVNGGMRMN